MPAPLLDLRISDDAEFQLSTLGEFDRRRVSAWFEHLRNWHNDEYIRSLSKRVPEMGNTYMLRTTSDWSIGFELDDGEVTIIAIFRKETVDAFAAAAQGKS